MEGTLFGRFPQTITELGDAVTDGDTIKVTTFENYYFPSRLCGVDTPETRYKLPKKGGGVNYGWKQMARKITIYRLSKK
jgi:endonuclease YncB( thermonuclease family)